MIAFIFSMVDNDHASLWGGLWYLIYYFQISVRYKAGNSFSNFVMNINTPRSYQNKNLNECNWTN